jgi:energy-converting hydrogenase Eha subunit E
MDATGRGALRLAWAQGIFYLATGVWPLVSIGTFQRVTGPKVDLWLVKTVGLLISVVGVALILAARRGRIAPEVRFLAAGSAAVLAAVDVVYALADRIWDVYLLDAVVEIGLVVLWGIVGRGRAAAPERATA